AHGLHASGRCAIGQYNRDERLFAEAVECLVFVGHPTVANAAGMGDPRVHEERMASTSASVTGGVVGALESDDIIRDYRIAFRSRQVSTLARGEVMLGRAMFGIFGDGKEVPQVALARAFQPGDIRSGYYRDQTLMFALGLLDVRGFFAQLYANTENDADPASAGRGMNAHFGTQMLEADGRFKKLTDEPHS